MTNGNGLENVLVFVDDNEALLNFIKRAVNRNIKDYTLIFFMDPRDAMEYIRIHKPALLWTDNDMPYIKGVELLAAMRELSPNTKRVLYTGNPNDRIDAATKNGVIELYLQKPLESKQVLDNVYEILKR